MNEDETDAAHVKSTIDSSLIYFASISSPPFENTNKQFTIVEGRDRIKVLLTCSFNVCLCIKVSNPNSCLIDD